MTTFQDGPAKGQILSLHRAPAFLRVVEANGKWDALDQLDDTPEPNEQIYVYVITGEPGMCHVYRRGGGSGWYAIASYRFFEVQPPDPVLRSTAEWRAWTREQADKAMTTAISCPDALQASAKRGEGRN